MADRLSARSAWDLIDQLRQGKGNHAGNAGTARVTRVDRDGTAWVSVPGSDGETPVNGSVVADVHPGDSVTYRIEGGRLSVTGSTSDPAVGRAAVDETVAPVAEAAGCAQDAADEAHGLAQAAKDVADATAQHFWHDDNGAHVSSEAGNATGAQNSVWNSLGMLFRKGANNLLALVTGSSPGVVIYDGAGNADGNIIASFVGNLIELGRNSTSAVIKFCGGKGLITYETGYDWMDIEADEGIHVSYQAKHKYSDLDPHWVSPAQGTVQSDVRLVHTDGNQYDTSTTWAIEAGMLMDARLNWHDDSTFLQNLHRAFVGAYTGNAETGYGTEDYVEEVPSRVEVGGRLLRVYVPEAVCNDGAGDIDTTFDMRKLVEVLKMAKTAGDSWTMHGYRATGYVTNGRTEFACTIATPYRFFGATGVTLSGTYTVRQNGGYHFGSTSSTPASLTGRHSATVDESGYISVNISTGAEQTGMVNNDPASVIFNSLTITLT